MFWVIIGVMLAAAVLAVALPLYRAEKKLSLTAIVTVVAIAGLSASMYAYIGTPNPAQPASGVPDVDEMVASLAARLQENPDDLAGWKMLGRSYFQLRNFPGAIAAFERAVDLEDAQDGQTLADLGEAVLMQDERSLNGRAGDLFENALALAPGNAKALFYSGLAAVERGERDLAADRWEALLATSPPPNVQDILRQRIAELRGTGAPQPSPPAPAGMQGPVVTVTVSLGDEAQAGSNEANTVFIIARDPEQPSPPLAAVRRQVGELPAVVGIGDADAMIPGRVPSAYEKLEIVARVSRSGQPIAESGDWYGQKIIDVAANESVNITIDQQVQ